MYVFWYKVKLLNSVDLTFFLRILVNGQQPLLISMRLVNKNLRQPPASLTSCPPASPFTADQCRGRHSTCWSVGVPDLDCPDWGLCCFDGCANTCANQQRVPEPIPPAPRRNPCDPNPCGPGSMCIPQVKN